MLKAERRIAQRHKAFHRAERLPEKDSVLISSANVNEGRRWSADKRPTTAIGSSVVPLKAE
jgi:hypothetical protein